MSVFRKVDKVLAALGNVRAMERLHVDTVTESKIENVGGDKIAESTEGQIWAGIQELNGYYFLETIILSGLNIKTFKGGKLFFTSQNGDFELPSDTQEIESDFSNVSNRFMTHISFDISDAEIKRIVAGDFQKVQFQFKKKTLNFIKADYATLDASEEE